MKITKLPNDWDPSRKIEEASRRKFSVCPVCGENREESECHLKAKGKVYPDFMWGGVERINYVPADGWYGPAKGDWLGWFIPSHYHYWQIDHYRCHTCGAEWESDPYPTDINGI